MFPKVLLQTDDDTLAAFENREELELKAATILCSNLIR